MTGVSSLTLFGDVGREGRRDQHGEGEANIQRGRDDHRGGGIAAGQGLDKCRRYVSPYSSRCYMRYIDIQTDLDQLLVRLILLIRQLASRLRSVLAPTERGSRRIRAVIRVVGEEHVVEHLVWGMSAIDTEYAYDMEATSYRSWRKYNPFTPSTYYRSE